MIERWYNPRSGTIKLDGRPIDQLNLNWLRNNVRLVQQEPVLFQGSVFDNIKNGLVGTQWENAPLEEQMEHVQEAAKMAFAHDFITQLPSSDGYDTILTITDKDCSKGTHFLPFKVLPMAEQTMAKYFTFIWNLYGTPSKILTDQRSQFMSDFLHHLLQSCQIQQGIISAYHPQIDRQSECTNQELEQS